jgi:hypothetical protein
MSEWWTYSLSSFLLFSPRTYYRLFELYNADAWPLQLFTIAIGLAICARTVFPAPPWSSRVIATMLSVVWLIVASLYLLERYDTINFAARYFALGFAAQAILLLWSGVIRDHLRADSGTIAAKIGIAMIAYAVAIHPLIAPLSGRPWTQAEIFGLVPDPTVIATLGVLVAAARPNWHLMVLPLLWCAISSLTLWTMESPEAPLPALAAAIAVGVAAWKSLSFRPPADG